MATETPETTEPTEIETLKDQNSKLLVALEAATLRLDEVAARLAPPAPVETMTEAARRMKSERKATDYPEGSLTRRALELSATSDARLVEVLHRRAQGLSDHEPAPAPASVGLTAQAEALRVRAR